MSRIYTLINAIVKSNEFINKMGANVEDEMLKLMTKDVDLK